MRCNGIAAQVLAQTDAGVVEGGEAALCRPGSDGALSRFIIVESLGRSKLRVFASNGSNVLLPNVPNDPNASNDPNDYRDFRMYPELSFSYFTDEKQALQRRERLVASSI